MDICDFHDLEIGDRIEFRSQTRYHCRKAIRQITYFPRVFEDIETWGRRSDDYVCVRYDGTGMFYVRRSEIIRKV